MGIKPGQTVDTFLIDGKKVILRCPKLSDYKAVHKFYNQVVQESLRGGGYLSRTAPVTLKEENEWVTSAVEKNKNGKCVNLLAFDGRKVIGSSAIEKGADDAHKHIGNFGIAILEQYTGKGLGTMLTKKTISIGKKTLKLEIAKLCVFGNNVRAQCLYKKLGFKEFGRIKNGRKVKGKYADDIFMVKYL